MAERMTPRRRGSYGIDAPFAPAFLAGLAVFYVVLAIVTGRVRFWLLVAFIVPCYRLKPSPSGGTASAGILCAAVVGPLGCVDGQRA